MSSSSYDLLIKRLDQFIRKYYLNKVIRGVLYSIGLVLALFLIFSLLEHQFYFTKSVRKTMFFSFIGVSVLAIGYWVCYPLLQYFNLGKTISHEQAANIIGDHFTDVKDKLLNILQLKNQSSSSINSELIEASIAQKTEGISLVPFKSAIDLSKNKKNLKYALPPLLLLLALLFAAPSMITESTHRIIHNDEEFEKAAPFHFDLEQDKYEVLAGEEVTIVSRVSGEEMPQDIFIDIDGFDYRMNQIDRDIFSYTLKNVQKDVNFRLFSGDVSSRENKITVLPKPLVEEFTLRLDYPNYTGRKDETVANIGDVFVPQGTNISWQFNTSSTDSLWMRFSSNANKIISLDESNDNLYKHNKRAMQTEIYSVMIANANTSLPDSAVYNLSVTPDNHPQISVESFADSIEQTTRYFIGSCSDDYGLTKLNLNYTITNQNGQLIRSQAEPINKAPNSEWTFDYILDVTTMALKPGDQLSYFFQVFDNDGVNGSKSTKSQTFTFDKPSLDELEEQEEANEAAIKDNLKDAIKESKELKKQIKELKDRILQKKELSWQEKKELEKLLEKQKEIQDKLKKAKEKFDENLEKQQEQEENPENLEKQEQLQEMFEEAIDEEKQDLLEQIQELMEELNKEEMMEDLNEFEMQEEMKEMETDRLLELFKQLEVEKEAQELIEKLEELAEKQEELAKQTEENKKSNEELKKEQEKINEEFEKLKEEMKKLQKENEELEFPKGLDEEKIEEESEEIQEELDKSSEELQKQDNKKASQKQKNASQKMKKMAGSLQGQMAGAEQEQAQEDIQALRQLLENLVTLSYDEEELSGDINKSQPNTPRYVELVQQQFKLKEDFGMISDSLYALSKRVDQIASFVTEKVVETETRFERTLDALENRKRNEAVDNQRRVMTNVNDLALMLSESLSQMQQQQQGASMPGSGQCDKPGGSGQGKPSNVPMDKISQGQKGLGEEMKKMSGKDGTKEGGNSAKDFAKAAAKQAALRKALEEKRDKLQEEGKGGQGLNEIIDMMNKIETDLVNKRLNNDLLKRQQDIETRLLKAEKADRKREKDNKRKGETAKQVAKTLPPELQEYLKNKQQETDIYKTVSPELLPHYQKLINKYYQELKDSK